ncbi:bifunctional DNA primase/polymerase [Amycolatopsis sp. NPDC049253]|uniref:bifunctional DNA primase/polymerase n=1 Tax=Amycolatopsis sp. NPDC049253 TaxID=3155274 RepID=UPI0034298A3D
MDHTDKTARDPHLAWALYLARRGWPVFPLHPGTKNQPAVKDWEHRATTDPARLHRCWQGRKWNVAVATGPARLVVVDCDVPKPGQDGPAGADALAEVAATRGGPLPATWTVTTPSGGTHRYYLAPPGVRLRNSAGRIAPRVDIRAGGGYVAAPGSATEQGVYRVTDETDPVELPAWVVQVCTERAGVTAARTTRPATPRARPGEATSAYVAAVVAAETAAIRAAAPGTRNDTLSRSAYALGQLVGAHALPEPDALAALEDAWATWGDDASAAKDLGPRGVIATALAAGKANPRRNLGRTAA